MRKHEIVTKAPNVGAANVHPTPSAGKKMDGIDLPPWLGSTGKESDFVRCKHCGFPVDRTKHPKGDGWGGNESATSTEQTHPITGSTIYYADPVVTAGCPLCGSSAYE